jgi:hypothetical protein
VDVLVPVLAVRVLGGLLHRWHEVELAVPHATLADRLIGQRAHLGHRPAQYGDLQA